MLDDQRCVRRRRRRHVHDRATGITVPSSMRSPRRHVNIYIHMVQPLSYVSHKQCVCVRCVHSENHTPSRTSHLSLCPRTAPYNLLCCVLHSSTPHAIVGIPSRGSVYTDSRIRLHNIRIVFGFGGHCRATQRWSGRAMQKPGTVTQCNHLYS